jgi:hypothetical protein
MRFDRSNFLALCGKTVQYTLADFLMCNRTALEADRCFYLIALFKELDRIAKLSVKVMFIDGWAQANLFRRDNFLIFTGFFVFLLLFELEFALLHNPGHRWLGVRCNKHQVKIYAACDFERFKFRFNSQLLAVLVNKANFASANAFVQQHLVFANS